MTTPSRLQRLTRTARLLGVLLTVSATVTACATVRPEPIRAPRVSPAACPQVTQYSQEFLDRVADAEEALPSDNPLVAVTDDWIKMRDQSRVCRRQK